MDVEKGDEIKIAERKFKSIFNVLSSVGGLYTIINAAIMVVMSPVVRVLHFMAFLSESYYTDEYVEGISLDKRDGIYPIDKLRFCHGFSVVIKELFHCNEIKLQKLLDKGE